MITLHHELRRKDEVLQLQNLKDCSDVAMFLLRDLSAENLKALYLYAEDGNDIVNFWNCDDDFVVNANDDVIIIIRDMIVSAYNLAL